MRSDLHVVRIVDEYTIIINGGIDDGIIPQSVLEVFIPGAPLHDPVDGVLLGNLDIVLARIKVDKAYERFSICKNAEHDISPMLQALANISMTGYSSRAKELPINVRDIEGLSAEEGRTIVVGDKVRLVITPDLKKLAVAQDEENEEDRGNDELRLPEP